MLKKISRIILWWLIAFSTAIYAVPLRIVAAENFYGQLAAQLGGPYVQVISILNNPQQDPHLFSSVPSTAKAIADAQLIIYNGLGYDPWVNHLITATHHENFHLICVGDLMHRTMGENPHIWYNPQTMWTLANHLVAQFSQLDPSHQSYYQQQLQIFQHDYQKLLANIDRIRQQYQGTLVIATESIFNDMAEALGLFMEGKSFQLSIMNGSEPSVTDTIDFENKLKNRQAKVLIYNNQVSNPTTERLQLLARKAGIPNIGVSETEPPEQTYASWMNLQLNNLVEALAKSEPLP